MNRRILLLLLISFCTNAYQTQETKYNANTGPLFNFARYELGELPKIQGYLAGIHADFELNTDHCFYTALNFNGRWNAGFISGNQDTKIHIKDYRSELFLGYSWCITNQLEVTPFTGLGFYYLSNELRPNVMTYRYFALFPPVGLNLNWHVCPDYFDVGLVTWYCPYVWRQLKLNTPCIEQCKPEKITLKYSQGVHFKLPLTWYQPCHENLNFQIKVVPFFDWNQFATSSENNNNCIEFEIPTLNQWYLGLYINFGISF